MSSVLPANVRRAVTGLALAAALAVPLGLAGCGSDSPAPSAAARPADPSAARAQDVAFATRLAEHEHRTLQLVGLAAAHAERPELLDVAGRVQTASDARLVELQTLLESWEAPVPHIEGHTDLGASIPGVLDEKRLAALLDSPAPEFERTFVATLVTHLEKGAALASEQVQRGSDPQAKAVAQQAVDETTAQLGTLEGLAG